MWWWLLLCLALRAVVASRLDLYDGPEKPLFESIPVASTSTLSTEDAYFKSAWHALGPFQIGTREEIWGSDPLEVYGGFRNLEPDANHTFSSSIAPNGTVRWSKTAVVAESDSGTRSKSKVTLRLYFPSIDWRSAQTVDGWDGLQWQAWARGSIAVTPGGSQTVTLHTDGVIEFWIDGQHYFGGDLYGFRKASPVLHLPPGSHQLDIRLVRDVRAMGAVGRPDIKVLLELEVLQDVLSVVEGGIVVSDIVDGKLASPLASVSLRNSGHNLLRITNIASADGSCNISRDKDFSIKLWPGQTRPIDFEIAMIRTTAKSLLLDITYTENGAEIRSNSLQVNLKLSRLSIGDPQKVTFLHPGGIVSYAILKPPEEVTPLLNNSQPLRLLVHLHGAGVEAESELARHYLDKLGNIRAMIIFPTGSTPWSGDDWHNWGFAGMDLVCNRLALASPELQCRYGLLAKRTCIDVEAAIASIPAWMKAVRWAGPQVDLEHWLVTGHSNGGQGTYYALTHRPDKLIAAAAVSGYSSIQKYVPYSHWQELEPRAMSIIQSTLADYRHETLLANANNIPILLQHGALDEIVPVYHSRKIHELLIDFAWPDPPQSRYYELSSRGHWFDGVMTTPELKDFFRRHLSLSSSVHEPPQTFSIIVANPGSTGSVYGIRILQLSLPGQLSKIQAWLDSSKLVLLTSNVRRLSVSGTYYGAKALVLDNQEVVPHLSSLDEDICEVVRLHNGLWKVSTRTPTDERYGRQLGALSAILNTDGRFSIVSPSKSTHWVAVQVSRNLLQYYGADSELLESKNSLASSSGNVISVALGLDSNVGHISSFPLHIDHAGRLVIRDDEGYRKTYTPGEHGLGAVFLKPRLDQGLEMIVWGSDVASLAVAARLVPTLTGAGQPDFVIMTRECLWKGLGGVVAMGFFDSHWNVSRTSFLS